jgi:hypothetical protein
VPGVRRNGLQDPQAGEGPRNADSGAVAVRDVTVAASCSEESRLVSDRLTI